MAEAGADLIEIGIPFSDPVAEGGVIQEASMQALAKGVTTDKIFDMVESIRDKVNIPRHYEVSGAGEAHKLGMIETNVQEKNTCFTTNRKI